MMKLAFMIAGIALVACASVGVAKPREPADATLMIVTGGSACPTGTTALYAGNAVVFKNPNNGNLTEDARCWQTAPTTTTEAGVVVMGPCVVCRLEQ
jgi:hypothetical protein